MTYNFLHNISGANSLKSLKIDELKLLSTELRSYIIDVVSEREGHLGASLGVVELTVALHYVFDTPNDLLIWDVGHQAYGHKILTGRFDGFKDIRQKNGISGFPKRTESQYDAFGTGHSSTSISAALGMAMASKIKGDIYKQHIAVIGDASIASGIAFEALNHAGVSDVNLLIILNDNAIGIDPSVGALKQFLISNKDKEVSYSNNIFTSLNINYTGVIDGHNLENLISVLQTLKEKKGVNILHINTIKGKGLKLAEEDQVKYHAPGKFDKNTGIIYPKSDSHLPDKFQDVFGYTILDLARNNDKIIGITPAMPTGSSLKFMMEEFPDRAFDVGIAEQHAVTLAAGLATQGMIVYVTIYSTFLQRAYDQLIHDVALQNLPVVFCVDRAGLVGEDGATHHGVFDIAYLSCIPNLKIYAPLNEVELKNILYTAQYLNDGPIAIRYPRGRGVLKDWERNSFKDIEIGKAIELRKGTKIAFLTTGFIGNYLSDILKDFDTENLVSHYHFGFIKPLDKEILTDVLKKYQQIITLEEGSVIGGFGASVLEFASEINSNTPVKVLGIPDKFIEHGSLSELYHDCGLDANSIKQTLSDIINKLI